MKVSKAHKALMISQRKLGSQAHRLLAVAVLVSGLWFISPLVMSVVNGEHLTWFAQNSWREVIDAIGLSQLPRVVISLSLLLMSFGLLSRARVAWAFTLVMLTPAIVITVYTHDGSITPYAIYDGVLLLVLMHFSTAFGRSSVTAGTLFALSSLASLAWYAILGALYLGHDFSPKILTLPDAIYFSMVSVSTVGFGDIVPTTEPARMFVVSVILLGVTVFASALGAVVVPLLTGKLRTIIERKGRFSMKKDHVILCGETPLALSLYESLIARGEQVTVILKPTAEHDYPASADIIFGDASNIAALEQAGVKRASHVIAMQAHDPDNAFVVLAVKAITDCDAKVVAVVNNNQNLQKIKQIKPDLLFSPQLFGAEVLARVMRGEKVDTDLVTELLGTRPLVDQADDQ